MRNSLFAALAALVLVSCGKKEDDKSGGAGTLPSPPSGTSPVSDMGTVEDLNPTSLRRREIGRAHV